MTLYTTLVSAFQTLLYRYTGQTDLLVGMVTAGRNQPVMQRLIGFFLNTLVLRARLSDTLTFRELLKQAQRTTVEALEYQDVPFEHVVKELHPERTLGQSPLIQAMISLEPALAILPSGWTLTQMDVETYTTKFDIILELDDRPEGLIGRFEYDTDLFDGSTIARMADHWRVLLESVASDIQQTLADIPLLTHAEQQQFAYWNETTLPYPQGQCIHSLFEEQAQRTPDELAIIHGNQHLTYAELDQRANRLATTLRQQGIGPESLVALYMERSLDMLTGILGILKAGGAYVPLDPAYPANRVAYILDDCQATVVVTQQHLRNRLPAHNAHVLCIEEIQATTSEPELLASKARVNDLAYIIYTSGSTGKPKGVAITHRNAVAFLSWAKSVFTLEELAGVLASTSVCFDLSIFELFTPLISGGTVILARNILELPTLSPARPITLLNTVPSALHEVLREHPLPSTVRTVNLAGEPLPGSLVEQVYQQAGVQRVYNLYGPSETTTYSTYTLVERGIQKPTIGRPIANTQVHILDAHLHPVPVGVPGELYIGGDGVTRGYLHKPEWTAQRFIPDPFRTQANAQLYKTGDLARYLPNGDIDFLGRADSQVKLRGFRIELGEIETLLRQQAGIHEAAVLVREEQSGNKRLVAYIVPTGSTAFQREPVRQALQEELPDYMVPSLFVVLDALPVTPNGKLDRQTLLARELDEQINDDTFVAPTQMLHYQLIAIWEELLDVHPIGIRDNFFDLGGHSLLATRMVARVEQVCGKKLSFNTLFTGPTIEQIADALQREQETQFQSPLIRVQTGESHTQKRPFFFLHGDVTGGAFYCFAIARTLGKEQPFYVIEPDMFSMSQAPLSIEETATLYIQAIREVQPEGPYLLGGFCNGGLMAYEMARQLRAQGQRLDLLVLIDPMKLPRLTWVHHVTHRLNKLARFSRERQLDAYLLSRHLYLLLSGKTPLTELFPNGHFAVTQLFPTRSILRDDYAGVWSWLFSNHTLGSYPDDVTILWAEQEHLDGVWRYKVEHERNITLRTVPGSHISCRTDYLPVLATHVQQCLQAVNSEM